MKKYRPLAVLALVAVLIGSCGKKGSESSQTAGGETTAGETAAGETPAGGNGAAKVDSKLVKTWMIGLTLRHPGMDARKGLSLGGGALGVKATANAVAWFEMIDVDSNGTQEKVGFMWDDSKKVMYAYTQDPVTLDDGTKADKGLVVAQFGEGNTADRPRDSGFWAYATTRDTMSYRLVEGSLYGCRFDASGEMTECGPGTWNRDNNNFTIKTMVK